MRLTIPTLVTARLQLRPLRPGDAAAVFAIHSDPEVTRWLFRPHHESVADSAELIATLAEDRFAAVAMIAAASEDFVGMCVFHSDRSHHLKTELAYRAGRRFWNRGYVTEAVDRLVRYVLGETAMNRIEATCMVDNRASERVLQKAGFRLEGVMRQSHRRGDGFHDMKLYALLADDLDAEPAGTRS